MMSVFLSVLLCCFLCLVLSNKAFLYEYTRMKQVPSPVFHSNERIIFWRPQKVGSSTLLSILLSYSYRYNKIPRIKTFQNSFCAKLARCYDKLMLMDSSIVNKYLSRLMKGKRGSVIEKDRMYESIPFSISTNHEVCNVNYSLIEKSLPCGFSPEKSTDLLDIKIRELFMVRNPLDRMISIYYFWGELFKMNMVRKEKGTRLSLGASSSSSKIIDSSLFSYHGNESSVPRDDIALDYARKFPLSTGMPGPSFTWSLFANSVEDALHVLEQDRIIPLVTERLDESLVSLSYVLNWTLAEVIYVLPRKSLSSHPKSKDWPLPTIQLLHQKLNSSGEYAIYNATNLALDRRIDAAIQNNFPFHEKVAEFRLLKSLVSEKCRDMTYLEFYRVQLSTQLPRHPSKNKLRDSDSQYDQLGHVFSWNGEILFSYDLCGSCEAHSLLYSVTKGLSSSLSTGLWWKDLSGQLSTPWDIQFSKCPDFKKPQATTIELAQYFQQPQHNQQILNNF